MSTTPAPGGDDGSGSRSAHLVALVRSLFSFDVGEQGLVLVHLGKWIGLGAVVGALAGVSSAAFLVTLNWATRTRLAHGWLIALLPLAGLAIGALYHYGGGRSAGGNNLIIDEIHDPADWIPRRMAPLVYLGSVATVLFGGSTGREGTALQMAGSLTDGFSRVVRLGAADRRVMLIAALAGGFGAMFGVPVAGMIFALEVQSIGRLRYDALVPAAAAALVGDLVVRGLGVHHEVPALVGPVDLSATLVAKVALAGLAFGLTAYAFSELTHGIRRVMAATVGWPPLRPFIGGFVVIAFTLIVGNQAYNGLSLGLAAEALAGGAGIISVAFAIKLVFTAVTLGSGFQGGEVTPLFVMGATLGVTLGRLLGVPVELMAAIGFVAVFAGAANVPLACTVMGAELFGADAIVLFAVACIVSYTCSPHEGIYHSQRIGVTKRGEVRAATPEPDPPEAPDAPDAPDAPNEVG